MRQFWKLALLSAGLMASMSAAAAEPPVCRDMVTAMTGLQLLAIVNSATVDPNRDVEAERTADLKNRAGWRNTVANMKCDVDRYDRVVSCLDERMRTEPRSLLTTKRGLDEVWKGCVAAPDAR